MKTNESRITKTVFACLTAQAIFAFITPVASGEDLSGTFKIPGETFKQGRR
jgi:hypothetical protein